MSPFRNSTRGILLDDQEYLMSYLLEALPASILSLEIPADGCHAPDSPEYPTPFLTMTVSFHLVNEYPRDFVGLIALPLSTKTWHQEERSNQTSHLKPIDLAPFIAQPFVLGGIGANVETVVVEYQDVSSGWHAG
ncbi:uncharacterized protein ARMOST_14410 [Armillaria ostoyae]|uniref:Uncharacterized protein n=1 Tax=Armillaria ostoyae TaxID=47428 RepID=A0A284RQI4_ARMOS|nr:uncharacterized protein ARMOST_14410 [Armillaria ostoyae]